MIETVHVLILSYMYKKIKTYGHEHHESKRHHISIIVLNYESHQNVARLQLQVLAFHIAMGKMLKTQFCLFECKVYRDCITSGFNRCYV